MGKQWKEWEALFFGTPKSLQMVTAAMKYKEAEWLSEEALQIAEKSREAKGKGEKERYPTFSLSSVTFIKKLFNSS